MNEYTTKDSGEREVFSTGAVCDVQTGKARFDLIPTNPLRRLAELYGRGAEKYGDNNWRSGIPVSRRFASLLRHAYDWAEGKEDEDHIIAVAWNAFALAWTLVAIQSGLLPKELDDRRDIPTQKP